MATVHAVAPQVARFELRYTVPENIIMNVFHVRSTAASWDIATMDAVEAAFVSWFTTNAATELNQQLALFEIVATDLTSLAGIRKVYPISPALQGNMNNEYLPANVTFAIKANIGNRGKGVNGRVFWPALGDTQVADNEMNVGAANSIQGILNTLKNDIAAVTGSAGLCIPHFVVNKVRVPSAANTLVTSFSYTDLLLDSQRDRLPGHKKHKKTPTTAP